MKELSQQAKASILTMTTLANSGHPGGSMSSLDLLNALYHCIYIDPQKPLLCERDKIIISHGHISPAVYTILALRGFFSLDDVITTFRLAGSRFEGHIESEVPGVEWASGNLGQGLSAATGFALESRIKKKKNRIYCLMGDGEQQKGQISEARRFAIKYKLTNLTAIIDYNQLQICGAINQIMPQNIKQNYESDGWTVLEINGHNYQEIIKALQESLLIDNPVLILARTVMGNGVSFMENKEKYHGVALTETELYKAFKEIGYSLPFVEYQQKRKSLLNNTLIEKIDFTEPPIYHFKTKLDQVYEHDLDPRSAWGDAIKDIALMNKEEYPLLAVFDCDLQGSVKTSEFAKIMPENFFQSGIMEHHTAVCAGALSKTDIQCFFPDFGVFGISETYNQHRLNDINKTNLKVILTHVGLDVGEDGKTHQCLDYIGLVNNLFNTRILIPADANQAYKMINFVVNEPGNYIISMGRSKLPIIKNEHNIPFYDQDYVYVYGQADLLRQGDHACMFVTGTLTNTAIKVVDELNKELISIRLINISSPLEINSDIITNAAKTGFIITLEDHNVYTGLGSIIANRMVEERVCCPLEKFGVDKYALSGASEDVYRFAQLDERKLVLMIKKALGKWS